MSYVIAGVLTLAYGAAVIVCGKEKLK